MVFFHVHAKFLHKVLKLGFNTMFKKCFSLGWTNYLAGRFIFNFTGITLFSEAQNRCRDFFAFFLAAIIIVFPSHLLPKTSYKVPKLGFNLVFL